MAPNVSQRKNKILKKQKKDGDGALSLHNSQFERRHSTIEDLVTVKDRSINGKKLISLIKDESKFAHIAPLDEVSDSSGSSNSKGSSPKSSVSDKAGGSSMLPAIGRSESPTDFRNEERRIKAAISAARDGSGESLNHRNEPSSFGGPAAGTGEEDYFNFEEGYTTNQEE
jgi:hypothetical protein